MDCSSLKPGRGQPVYPLRPGKAPLLAKSAEPAEACPVANASSGITSGSSLMICRCDGHGNAKPRIAVSGHIIAEREAQRTLA